MVSCNQAVPYSKVPLVPRDAAPFLYSLFRVALPAVSVSLQLPSQLPPGQSSVVVVLPLTLVFLLLPAVSLLLDLLSLSCLQGCLLLLLLCLWTYSFSSCLIAPAVPPDNRGGFTAVLPA